MKNYEKQLLERLRKNDLDTANEPLKNVREALGNIAFVKGNPLTKTEITINVNKYIVGVVPANYQLPVPIYLFGLTDYLGGYKKARVYQPLKPPLLVGAGLPAGYYGIIGLNISLATVQTSFPTVACDLGDLIYIFYDSPAPAFYIVIIIHCENVAYGTFLNSFVSDLITINTLRYVVPIANVNQFINPLTFGYQTLFGKTFTDDIDPRNFITNKDFQQQIADIPINLPIDKSVFLITEMDYLCNSFSLILFVEKVEALTHKNIK